MTDNTPHTVLDHVHVTYSYRRHCMVSLVVGDAPAPDQWHLPTLDPRNEAKYHYPLHSLDVYFWTHHDALAFVDGVRRVLPPGQVDVQDEPAPPPQQQQQQQQQPAQQVSAVVQQLENAAISESNTHHHLPGPPPGAPSFAPPPVADPRDPSPSHTTTTTTTTTSPAASFAPMAYNPAAPAAPEHIRPREKTPPPEDDDDDNDNSNGSGGLLRLGNHPLHARLAQDAATPFSPGLLSGMPSTPANMKSPLSPGVPPPQFHAPPGAPSFPGPPLGSPGLPPQHMTHGYGTYGGGGAPTPMTPSHPGLQRAATVPVTQHTAAVAALASPTYGGSFSQQQQQPGTPTPAYTPTVPTYHPQQVQLQQQQQQQPRTTPPVVSSPGALPPPPPGGYSNYSYTTTQQQQRQQQGHNEYAIHQVAYRPTEHEQAVQYVPKKEVRGRLEDRAGKLEKGVTGMLKRFEKKFG